MYACLCSWTLLWTCYAIFVRRMILKDLWSIKLRYLTSHIYSFQSRRSIWTCITDISYRPLYTMWFEKNSIRCNSDIRFLNPWLPPTETSLELVPHASHIPSCNLRISMWKHHKRALTLNNDTWCPGPNSRQIQRSKILMHMTLHCFQQHIFSRCTA